MTEKIDGLEKKQFKRHYIRQKLKFSRFIIFEKISREVILAIPQFSKTSRESNFAIRHFRGSKKEFDFATFAKP